MVQATHVEKKIGKKKIVIIMVLFPAVEQRWFFFFLNYYYHTPDHLIIRLLPLALKTLNVGLDSPPPLGEDTSRYPFTHCTHIKKKPKTK